MSEPTPDAVPDQVGALTSAAQMVGVSMAREVGQVARALQQHKTLDGCDAPDLAALIARLSEVEYQATRYAVANGWRPRA